MALSSASGASPQPSRTQTKQRVFSGGGADRRVRLQRPLIGRHADGIAVRTMAICFTNWALAGW